MSKKNRAPKVEIRTSDELAVYSDEELSSRLNFLNAELVKRESVAHEVEVCYVQREQQIRETRRACHAEYLANLQKDEVSEHLLEEYVPTTPPPYWVPRNYN